MAEGQKPLTTALGFEFERTLVIILSPQEQKQLTGGRGVFFLLFILTLRIPSLATAQRSHMLTFQS